MSVIEGLAKEFTRLPGVGPKTATRLVYHLMKRPKEEATHLAEAILEVVRRIIPCARCGNFSESEICDICSDPRREMGVLCVVEEAYEVGSIERTGRFAGRYHVLGGRLSPLDGVGPDELSIVPLLQRLDTEGFDEVIVATNSSMEGEATAVYLEGLIRPLGPRVTRLARGIPVGSDLEYVDGSTIAEALAGRREM